MTYSSATKPINSCKSFQILLVEDNPHDALLIRRTILRQGQDNWNLVQVERLNEAIDLCHEYQRLTSSTFDIVLLDLRLPDSSGLETVTQFRAVFPHLPIVVLTGLDDETLALKTIRVGAQDYLIKEVTTIKQLQQSIQFAIARHAS
jgi:CheY-like chemotaxis protein